MATIYRGPGGSAPGQPPVAGARQPATNPFNSVIARRNSSYAAFRDGALHYPATPDRAPTPQLEFVHDSFRALVLNPRFACLAAKSAVHHDAYRMGVYGPMASAETSAGLARDLWTFVLEQPAIASDFTTFVASFDGPIAADERRFEQLLWTQLQALHDRDRRFHRWDPAVSSNPDDKEFSFSCAGRAFFVIGMHPASSRWTRRFAWPTLIFNAHHQFEQLRANGVYDRMKHTIRDRDRALQGSHNAMLSDFGDRSEARQYSGRMVEDAWTCPFHAHTGDENDPPA